MFQPRPKSRRLRSCVAVLLRELCVCALQKIDARLSLGARVRQPRDRHARPHLEALHVRVRLDVARLGGAALGVAVPLFYALSAAGFAATSVATARWERGKRA